MKLRFDEMQEKGLPNFKGGEGVFYAKMYPLPVPPSG